MAAKRRIAGARPIGKPRPPVQDEPQESPEWIAKLRDRVVGEGARKREFAEKAGKFILELMDLSEASLTDAAEAPDNWHAMFRAMRAPELLEQMQQSDPLARAFLDGLDAKRELLAQNGGVFKTEQVADYLGISPQAVNKRRMFHQLLGITFRKRGFLYPGWQFTGTGTVPGLDDVLHALAEHDEWMQNVFFISPNTWVGGRRPVDLLREGKIQDVIEAAKQFGEHGAA
jgi:hypothetical protein